MIPLIGGHRAITNAGPPNAIALIVILVIKHPIGGELIIGPRLIARIGAVAIGIVAVGFSALGCIVRSSILLWMTRFNSANDIHYCLNSATFS